MNENRNTSELFNMFTDTVLKEHANNKKLYDECVRTYKTTQLFDFTHAMTYDTYYSAISTNQNDKLMFIISNLHANIPSDSAYIKITDKTSMFLRDYSINIITGCFIYDFDYGILKLPFTIYNKYDKSCEVIFNSNGIIDKFVEDMENKNHAKIIQCILNDVIESLQILQKMHNQIILIDEIEKPKNKYYRLKSTKETIKITQKPIYIILEESKHKKKYKSIADIKTQGNITRCFSFPVMGHWRRLQNKNKIGKDKHGNYNIQGFTWVTPFIKGDKSMPIVRKEHIVL